MCSSDLDAEARGLRFFDLFPGVLDRLAEEVPALGVADQASLDAHFLHLVNSHFSRVRTASFEVTILRGY